jgi:hypothetical protein
MMCCMLEISAYDNELANYVMVMDRIDESLTLTLTKTNAFAYEYEVVVIHIGSLPYSVGIHS